MKIFQSLAQLESTSGGPARSVPQLSLELVKRGHQVGLWAPEKLVEPLADITAEANRVCDAAGSIQVGDAAATTKNNESIKRVCVGQTSCRVVCKLDTPCPYGVQSISPTDGVLCANLSSECGNGICDRGENPMACPADCGGECMAGQKRCVDDKISTCTPRLRWEEAIGCDIDEACSMVDGVAACAPRDETDAEMSRNDAEDRAEGAGGAGG